MRGRAGEKKMEKMALGEEFLDGGGLTKEPGLVNTSPGMVLRSDLVSLLNAAQGEDYEEQLSALLSQNNDHFFNAQKLRAVFGVKLFAMLMSDLAGIMS